MELMVNEIREKLITNFDEIRGLLRRITLIPDPVTNADDCFMDVKISVEWNPKREKFNIEIKSNDISNPIINLGWKEFKIVSFDSGWLQKLENDVIEVGVELWFFYRNHYDGTNCTEIGHIKARSDEDYKWKFIPRNGYNYV